MNGCLGTIQDWEPGVVVAVVVKLAGVADGLVDGASLNVARNGMRRMEAWRGWRKKEGGSDGGGEEW